MGLKGEIAQKLPRQAQLGSCNYTITQQAGSQGDWWLWSWRDQRSHHHLFLNSIPKKIQNMGCFQSAK